MLFNIYLNFRPFTCILLQYDEYLEKLNDFYNLQSKGLMYLILNLSDKKEVFEILRHKNTKIFRFAEEISNSFCPRSMVYSTSEVALTWDTASEACQESGGTLARAVTTGEVSLLQAFK